MCKQVMEMVVRTFGTLGRCNLRDFCWWFFQKGFKHRIN
uniref:Uncharacterized protein n=1 Tax=Rhizophora mucronata TaxID=61149 RepID=A0A2P2NRX7_RHIMU